MAFTPRIAAWSKSRCKSATCFRDVRNAWSWPTGNSPAFARSGRKRKPR